MSLVVEDDTASFYSGDQLVTSQTYAAALNEGEVGLYVFNAHTSYDNVELTVPTPEPDAVDDTSQTTSGQSIVIDVLANDVPVEGTTISIKSVEAGEGDVAIEDGKLTYTPADGFRGTDTFSYTIQDSDSLTDTADVRVTVAAGLPIEEDLSDGEAQDFATVMGNWTVENGRWHTISEKGKFGLAVANIGEALPSECSVEAVLNGQGGGGGFWSNAFVIADYQDNENFKFAGSFIGGNTWTIGEVIGGTIHRRAEKPETVNANTDYHVKADISGRVLTLIANDEVKLSHTFGDGLSDGRVGVGTIKARASFDDIVIKAATPMPEAKADTANTLRGQSVVIDVLANDIPVDGTTLSLEGIHGGEGDIAITDGKVTYMPSAGFSGQDVFTYTIEDSDGFTDSAKVTVTVAAALPIEDNFKNLRNKEECLVATHPSSGQKRISLSEKIINNAKEESVNTILDYVNRKKNGEIDKVYVTGCLSERYKSDLYNEIPDVDQYFGTTDMPNLLKELGADYKHELVGDRIATTPKNYAYLKISEGCDRTCSFCAIPLMRGKHRSRSIDEILLLSLIHI